MRWTLLTIFFLSQLFNRVQGQDSIYPYIENGKIGFKNLQDSILVFPKYDYYEPFQSTQQYTIIGLGKYERLNFNDTERQVKFVGTFGIIDSIGNEIVPPSFDIVFQVLDNYTIGGRGEGYFIFNNWPEGKEIFFKGKMGVVKHDGNVIVPFKYSEIREIRSETIPFWFALDDQGKSSLYYDSVLLDFRDDVIEVSDFSEGRAKIQVHSKYGFIDTSGTVVVQPIYEQAKNYNSGKAFMKKGNQYVWLDLSGKEIEDFEQIIFEEIGPFSEGYSRVKIFNDYGFIYPDSSFFIFPRFSEATPFFNQLASVRSSGHFGYVFTDGSEDIVKLYTRNNLTRVPKEDIREDFLSDSYAVVNSKDSAYFFEPLDTLTLEKFISIQAEAMRWAPYLYFNYPNMLSKVSAGEGTLAGRYLFNTTFLNPGTEIWENYKNKVLLKLFSEEKIRSLLWKTFSPVFKSSFQSMPELHQRVYLEMIEYLEMYFKEYDIIATRKFLEENEAFFAYEHPDGTTSPYRKTSAQIDRLILIYEIISVEEVQKWIRKIKKEVYRW